MKVYLEDYNPDWTTLFESIKQEISQPLQFLQPTIEHIGSTSIPNLKAKPIIDILVGIPNTKDIDLTVHPLIQNDYIYYEKFNSVMPYRRFFVKLKNKPTSLLLPSIFYSEDEIPNELNDYKLAHIHILEFNSYHWKRHIAFRDYITFHETVKRNYENLKIILSRIEWKDGNEYNAAKNDFIKDIEAKALEWYSNI